MSQKDKPTRVKLIVNPGAGNAAESGKNLKLVLSYLKQNGLKVDIAMAKPKEEATPIARRAAKDGFKIVIAMGGDGTIEAVMRGLVDSKTRLGIIPAGTENNIALSLGIPTNLEEACALIASDNTAKFDMGQVKTTNGKKFMFFEMATVGLLAAIYPDANKIASGKLSRIKAAALTFIRQEAKPTVYLTLNDESKIEVETMLVMVSNTPTFGKKFKVAPGAFLNDGLLDISVYPNFSKSELLGYYAAVMNGGYSGDGKVQQYQARKIKIKSSPKLGIMADGMALGKGPVTIKVRKNALRVITQNASPDPDTLKTGAPEAVAPEPVSQTAGENPPAVSVISLG